MEELLRKRPRISQGTLDDAWLCEEHTFGEAYAQFMGTRSFSPRERPAIRFFVSSDLAYLALVLNLMISWAIWMFHQRHI